MILFCESSPLIANILQLAGILFFLALLLAIKRYYEFMKTPNNAPTINDLIKEKKKGHKKQ